MFSPFSITCFVLAAAGFAAGGGYGLAAGNDQGGSALFFFAAAAAAALGVAAAILGARDPRVAASASAEDTPGRRPLGAPEAVSPSSWPVLGAVALLLVGVGLATDAPILIIGLIAVAIASLGWLGQAWREHPAWNPTYDDRIRDRYVTPIALPIATIAGVAVLAISVSRLLLAVSEKAAPIIATVLAIAILGAFALLAVKPVGRGGSVALAVVGVLFVAASGIGGAVAGEREFHHAASESASGDGHGDGHGSEPETNESEVVDGDAHGGEEKKEKGSGEAVEVKLVADQIAFDTDELEAPAGASVVVKLHNADEGVPHNVSFYERKGGKAVVVGEIVSGPADTVVKVTAPSEGSLYFQCDVHPEMSGELVVA